MIRFILRRKQKERVSGAERTDLENIDAEVPELQAALVRGGFGEGMYDFSEVIGAFVSGPSPNVEPSLGSATPPGLDRLYKAAGPFVRLAAIDAALALKEGEKT